MCVIPCTRMYNFPLTWQSQSIITHRYSSEGGVVQEIGEVRGNDVVVLIIMSIGIVAVILIVLKLSSRLQLATKI